MEQRCHTRDLRVGMYVILPLRWWEHPFARNHFLITSEDLLQRVLECIDGEVLIDPDRSQAPAEEAPAEPQEPVVTQEVATGASNLAEAIADPKQPPAQKAFRIAKHSRELMQSVLEKPTAPNIAAAKEAIASVADLIVADRATASNLLSVSSHDYETYAHSVNVGVFSISLAHRLYGDTSRHNLRELRAAFFLHDLGKTRIPLAILKKPGRLDDDELAIMRTHPQHTYDILRETDAATEECRIIAMQHHERADGGGYPLGLKGDEIHEYGRICSIADVFDALVARRPYKPPLSVFDTLSIMRDRMIGHFSRPMFENFVLMFAARKAA